MFSNEQFEKASDACRAALAGMDQNIRDNLVAVIYDDDRPIVIVDTDRDFMSEQAIQENLEKSGVALPGNGEVCRRLVRLLSSTNLSAVKDGYGRNIHPSPVATTAHQLNYFLWGRMFDWRNLSRERFLMLSFDDEEHQYLRYSVIPYEKEPVA